MLNASHCGRSIDWQGWLSIWIYEHHRRILVVSSRDCPGQSSLRKLVWLRSHSVKHDPIRCSTPSMSSNGSGLWLINSSNGIFLSMIWRPRLWWEWIHSVINETKLTGASIDSKWLPVNMSSQDKRLVDSHRHASDPLRKITRLDTDCMLLLAVIHAASKAI